MDHLRLFSLHKNEYIPCWRGMCSGQCLIWDQAGAIRFQQALHAESELAFAKWKAQVDSQVSERIQLVNLIITIAWFKE
jgi:hypothetical protein